MTKYHALYRMRQALRYLTLYHRAKPLDALVPRIAPARPRNVTAHAGEREAILAKAAKNPGLLLYILLCSDLAIRSGTVAKIGWEHYDELRQELRFQTKWQERLTLPVTKEIAELIAQTNPRNPNPFIQQLWKTPGRSVPAVLCQQTRCRAFERCRKAAGITRKLTAHDLRRTTALGVYRRTRDLRMVQSVLGHRNLKSTVEYLDHDLVEVPRLILEAVKPQRTLAREEQTA